jgi:hypothetical protein
MPKLCGKVVETRIAADGAVMTRRAGHKYWDRNGKWGMWEPTPHGGWTCWGRMHPDTADEFNNVDAKSLTMIHPGRR